MPSKTTKSPAKKPQERTRHEPLFLTAALAFTAGDGEAKKFQGVAYSGDLIPDWNHVIDLATTEVRAPMPLLFQHRGDQIVGSLETANKNGGLQVAGSMFNDIDDQAADIVAKAARGIRYQMSVRLEFFSEERINAGSKVSVNGREFTGPLSVLRRGVIRECSVVALGADPNTSAEFFAARNQKPERNMDPTVEQLQARIAELETQVANIPDLTKRAEAAEAEVKSVRLTARTDAVKALFKDTGREFSDAAAAPYLELSAASFEAISKDMRAQAKALPQHLFQERATGAAGEAGGVQASAGNSALLADAKRRGWTGDKASN